MSSFSVTCSRLRQYIRQRGGGSLADVAVTLLPPPTTTTTTMNLLPGLELEEEVADKSQPLTIFYGGKVLISDKFPAAKAEDLMKMASSGSSAASTRQVSPPVGDLPIARKRSLHRFLEKRQERFHSNEPYQLNGCPQPLQNKAKLTHSWLGLEEDSVPLVEE